eukprot:gene21154-23234_t
MTQYTGSKKMVTRKGIFRVQYSYDVMPSKYIIYCYKLSVRKIFFRSRTFRANKVCCGIFGGYSNSLQLQCMENQAQKSWNALFKRQHASSPSSNRENETEKRAKRDQADPHICLICCQELTRGSKSYKERHWKRRHEGEKGNFQHSIVPKNHARAQELLQQSKSQDKKNEETSISTVNEKEPEETELGILEHEIDWEDDEPPPISPLDPLDESLPDERMDQNPAPILSVDATNVLSTSYVNVDLSTAEASTNMPVQASSTSTWTSENQSSAATVQSTVTSFFKRPTEEPEEGPQDAIARIEDGVNRILVRMDALNIQEAGVEMHGDRDIESVRVADLKAANNLVEVANCQQIRVETLADGCRVTCIPCNEYIRANPLMKINAANRSWGRGLNYDASRTEQYMGGSHQEWYSFKNRLVEHFSCSSTRNGGQFHLRSLQHQLKEKHRTDRNIRVNVHLVAAGIEICKIKSAGMSYESLIAFLSFCQADVGNIGHGRNQFPDIIKAAYIYVLKQTRLYMHEPLLSTGLPPHFSVAIDKSTPHRDTNHAVMIIVQVDGRRIAMPIDAPLVYGYEEDEDGANVELQGGSGIDLAEQVVAVLKTKLQLTTDDLQFLRGVHADGQYQASTFQNRLHRILGIREIPDPYFLLPWDVSHWMDLAMVELREHSDSSGFMKLLIKRSNRLHTMFGRGRGHAEYKGLAKILGLKALETVTYATTRFTSSSFEQWHKIYISYPALIAAFAQYREDGDDECEETKYQVRGQDYAIDLCGMIDIMKPGVTLMIKCQALSIPPWKIVAWFPKVMTTISMIEDELGRLKNAQVLTPNKDLLPKLSTHWEELTKEKIEDCTFQGITVYPGWLVVDERNEVNEDTSSERRRNQKKKKTITWNARSPEDCLEDLLQLSQQLRVLLTTRYDEIVTDSIKEMECIFDIESLVRQLCIFSFENGRIKVSREGKELWDLRGKTEFAKFYRYICKLPHVAKLLDEQPMLDLMPHNSDTVLGRFKKTVMAMMWHGLGNCASRMFVDNDNEPITAFEKHQLISASISDLPSIDQWFLLTFSSGEIVKARINEEFVFTSMYQNEDVVNSLGKEFCIALDVALAVSGCEAIVEGFYSLVSAHKKSGGQSNEVLTHRAIVDWSLPHPVSCPTTMRAIAKIYTEGDDSHSLPKHRLPVFGDVRERAFSKYDVSKVVDRMKNERPRCPHVLKDYI